MALAIMSLAGAALFAQPHTVVKLPSLTSGSSWNVIDRVGCTTGGRIVTRNMKSGAESNPQEIAERGYAAQVVREANFAPSATAADPSLAGSVRFLTAKVGEVTRPSAMHTLAVDGKTYPVEFVSSDQNPSTIIRSSSVDEKSALANDRLVELLRASGATIGSLEASEWKITPPGLRALGASYLTGLANATCKTRSDTDASLSLSCQASSTEGGVVTMSIDFGFDGTVNEVRSAKLEVKRQRLARGTREIGGEQVDSYEFRSCSIEVEQKPK
jgi:hypothetical protein